MSPRLTTVMRVGALRRRVEAAGGFATILKRGDAQAGAALVLASHNGSQYRILEAVLGADGRYAIVRVGPHESESRNELDEYLTGRRHADPDVWLIEVDVADAERFAAETIAPA